MDSDVSDEHLRSFGEYSSLDTSLNECFLLQESNNVSKNPVTVAINKLLQFQADHYTSNRATIQMAKIQNEVPGSGIEIPLSKKQMEKRASQKFSFEYYVFCEKCKEVTKHQEKCLQCDIITAKTRENFFIYIPVKQQLLLMLHKHLDTILPFLQKDRVEGMIGDLYDGKIYQKIKSENPDVTILSLTFNLDGASVSKSSNASIWPILLYQNYLPPSMRFMKENVLLAGVICTGKIKLDLSKLILPFIVEMNQLFNDQISLIRNGQIHHFLPLVMFCLCDLPARSDVQQIKYVSGYYACPVCIQKGTLVRGKGNSSYVRYIKTKEKPKMRTHIQFIDDTLQYAKTKKNIHGLKGITPLVALPCFDVVDNVSTDHMHGVFLGVMKDIIDIWYGKKKLKNVQSGFKISKSEDRVKLNKTIVQLKPYSRITRKPRSLFDRSYYKATEYRNLLWFYMHYALYGVLSQSAINHFDLLSASTYILDKSEISKNEIDHAGQMLEKFVDDFERFYGPDSITMNIHILRHYAHNVLNGGPLWSQSMFGFESKMGEFTKGHRSKVCISESIAKKYCLNNVENVRPKLDEKVIMLREKSVDVNLSIVKIFKKKGLLPINGGSRYKISYEIRRNSEIFKSKSSHITKSVDYFVSMKDDTIGIIELFVRNDENVYVLIQPYEISHEKHHLKEVNLKKPIQYQLFHCNEICEKLIYLKYGKREVVTKEPNKYEKT